MEFLLSANLSEDFFIVSFCLTQSKLQCGLPPMCCQMVSALYCLNRLLRNVTALEQSLFKSPEYSIDGKCSDILLINESCEELGLRRR